MRTFRWWAVAALLLMALAPPAAARPAAEPIREPNPHLALLPAGAEPNWEYWNAVARERSAARPDDALLARARSAATVPVEESEPPDTGGVNDTQATAQFVAGLGTGAGEDLEAGISGTLVPAPPGAPIGPFAEDDGSIDLANPTGLSAERVVDTSGTIGDGPHGSAGTGTGDFDVYGVTVEEVGAELFAEVTVDDAGLDPVVAVFNERGALLDVDGSDGLLTVLPWAPGDYFVVVGGAGTQLRNMFDPSSGAGAGSEGEYDLTVGLLESDVDHYSFDVEPGDVIGATVSGGAERVALFDPDGKEVIGSWEDLTFVAPGDTELPGGGNAVLSHVAGRAGRYALAVEAGFGEYDALVRLRRPALEREPEGAWQTVFLDFDGEEVNTGIFGGPGVRTLSPLEDYLPGWGLGPEDTDAVIDAVVAEVEENLSEDLRDRGANPDVDVEILNSRDHSDPFGQDNVSRVIVGGSIREAGIETIGIAQAIDVGNFDQTESALVLLDRLSAPAGEHGPPPDSLNYWAGPGTDKVALVGTGVGNIVSHEAGHFLGDFHTEPLGDNVDGEWVASPPNLMDPGPYLWNLIGPGPDGVGGTADDTDTDFGDDVFPTAPGGFTGIQDTLNPVAFALMTGRTARGE